jgi:tetratricopeptide (TPR) repeat protein
VSIGALNLAQNSFMFKVWASALAILALVAFGLLSYRSYLLHPRRIDPTPTKIMHRDPILIPGVQEPDEMRVEPFPAASLTPPEQMLAAAMQEVGNNSKPDALLPALDRILKKYPDYSDGYTMRLAALCSGNDLKAILLNLNSALKYVDNSRVGKDSRNGLLSMRAKIEHTQGDDSETVKDLESAVRANLADSPQFVNSGGVAPEKTAGACTWTEPDMDALVQRFPNDYRSHEFRGLYYAFFASWHEPSLNAAVDNLRRAIEINRNDAGLHFLIANAFNRAFSIKRYGLSDADRAKLDQTILGELSKALNLDPNLLPALGQRAQAYFDLKQFAQAVPDYDKIVAFDPKNSGAYNDRGLAKMELGDLYGAISDFGTALENKERLLQQTSTVENRADAYMKTQQWDLAIIDLTSAISLQIGGVSLLSNIRQFRALYPEYKTASDEAVTRKLNQTFYPNMKYEDFSKGFLDGAKAFWGSTTIPDLYLKRADACLRKNDWTRAATEFHRAANGFPTYSDGFERWREVTVERNPSRHLYVDLKTFDSKDTKSIKLWTKRTQSSSEDGPFIVERYEMNCGLQQLRTVSIASYSATGALISSREGGKWESVIPETLGERLARGACQGN